MSGFTATVEVAPTPEATAEAFWALDAEGQADFFAALENIAGHHLCFQMVAVIDEIRRRSEIGDYKAMHGFQTMLSHAQGFVESAAEMRAWEARREIKRLVAAATGETE